MEIQERWNNLISWIVKEFTGPTSHISVGALTAFLMKTGHLFLGMISLGIFILYEFCNLWKDDEPSQEILEFGAGWYSTIFIMLLLEYCFGIII